jgi:hypothetical protein
LIQVSLCGSFNFDLISVIPDFHKSVLYHLSAVFIIIKIPVYKVNKGIEILFEDVFKI